MDFKQFTDDELLGEYNKRRGASTAVPTQTPAPTPTNDISGILSQLGASGLLPKKKGVRENIADSMLAFAGKPPLKMETDEYGDVGKTILNETIKNQFEDPIDKQLKEGRLKAINAGITTDEQGNIIKTSDVARDERENRMRDFEGRRQASQLRGELNQNTYVKRFQEMNSAATGIDAILSDTISRTDNKSKNVGDQALITLYNKILDPLSVVRESEYARTPEGQSLMNRIAGFAQKVQAGGSGLTDADRIEVARAAKVLINNSGELYNTKISDYEGLANSIGADPKFVTGGYQKFSPYDIEKQYLPQTPSAPASGSGSATKSGNRFRKVG